MEDDAMTYWYFSGVKYNAQEAKKDITKKDIKGVVTISRTNYFPLLYILEEYGSDFIINCVTQISKKDYMLKLKEFNK